MDEASRVQLESTKPSAGRRYATKEARDPDVTAREHRDDACSRALPPAIMQPLPKWTQGEKPNGPYDHYDIAARPPYNSSTSLLSPSRKVAMGLLSALCSLAFLLLAWPTESLESAVGGVQTNGFLAEPTRHSTGLTDAVQWDNYSLWIDGQRMFLQCVSLV